jgi:cyclase
LSRLAKRIIPCLDVDAGRADAVLAASIFHFRERTIRESKEYLQSRGMAVRL